MNRTHRHVFSAALIVLAYLLLPSLTAQGSETYPYNGIYTQRANVFAFTNATIITAPGKEVRGATLLIRDGKIEAVGTDLRVPKGAVVTDLAGKYIYPSFIDAYAQYGIAEAKPIEQDRSGRPQMLSNREGAYGWNEALKPDYRADQEFSPDKKDAEAWRKLGFGAVATHQQDGISRGTGAVVLLSDEDARELLLKEQAAHYLSFRKGVSTQDYPSSLMGSIALLRQTYLDGQWYGKQNRETNLSLAAWNRVQDLPQVFATDNWQDVLRAEKLAKEFGKKYVIKGSGDEYQRLDALRAAGMSFILPLKFPDAYDVADPYAARIVSVEQLRHWEQAPTNAAKLIAAGITVALTADGLEKKTDFPEAVRKAIAGGLSEEAALRALTVTPATLLGVADRVGTLEKGKVANFLVTDGPLFDKKTVVHHNWVHGLPYVLTPLDVTALAGEYDLKIGNATYDLTVKGTPGKESAVIKLAGDSTEQKIKHSLDGKLVTITYQPKDAEGELTYYRLQGTVGEDGNWNGRGQDPAGEWVNWSARRTGDVVDKDDEKEKDKEDKKSALVSRLTYPNTAYGREAAPKVERVLFRNATVWTNEADGILTETDVLIENGKIARVGKNLPTAGARVIDAAGKHLTSGVIDEHSHIAISRGVNEGTQASTAEVRIGDVVDATDINIYRQLAGGVTVSQLLHGSANPIGGQSAIVKLRWGATPEEMKFAAAPPFIKFALGENVKQSNWGDDQRYRYPQTRMGVEQVFESYFTRAREYGDLVKSGKPFRRDLELEALLEILNNKRFITCHSYQQGEINMLMQLADRMGFRVNTFTHILEGYKVADKMAEHGAGGSTFADWWAYKFEVIEAIPYNGALMHEQGVLVAFNSDDDEMARRLNQEAAKAVLFGGVSEEEAWKFVTLNPAKLMHVEDRVGSIRTGKDADLVLWSANPLSVYARADYTFVDGREYYSRTADEQARLALETERNALIQKSLTEKMGGAKTQKPENNGNGRIHRHCDDFSDFH
ncbi:MAG: amidohydrolase family protein [Saprospiraceae bacterium]